MIKHGKCRHKAPDNTDGTFVTENIAWQQRWVGASLHKSDLTTVRNLLCRLI